MAILQKTREKAGLAVSIIIALALLSFIIDPSTLESAIQMMSSKNNVGEINGKSVSYTDFQQDIETFTTINEMMTGSTAQNEQQQEQIRNAAWQNLLDKYLFTKKATEAGIFLQGRSSGFHQQCFHGQHWPSCRLLELHQEHGPNPAVLR